MNAEVTKINKIIIKADSNGFRVKVEIEDGNVIKAVVTKLYGEDKVFSSSLFLGDLCTMRGLHEALTKVLTDAEHYCER